MGFGLPFVVIGERINPTGRKVLAAEMLRGDYSRVEADALAQVAAGAQMLDVNAGIPLADEPRILAESIQLVQSITDVPLSIDSSIIEALEASSTSKGNGVQGDAEQQEYFHRVGNYDAKCSHQDIHGSDTIRFPKRTDAPKRNMQNIDAVQRMRDEGISEEQKDSETKEKNTNISLVGSNVKYIDKKGNFLSFSNLPIDHFSIWSRLFLSAKYSIVVGMSKKAPQPSSLFKSPSYGVTLSLVP